MDSTLHRGVFLWLSVDARSRIALHALCGNLGGGITPRRIPLALCRRTQSDRTTHFYNFGGVGSHRALSVVASAVVSHCGHILLWTLAVESHRAAPSRRAQSDHTAHPLRPMSDDTYGKLAYDLVLRAKLSMELDQLLPYDGPLVRLILQEQHDLDSKIGGWRSME
ncbi:hypothetical protein B0H14DRAFT_3866544 [Mycena olivaceomarginata]|nr:hypothetical protein B0H14DRAFT_3866544 [Mycena olivaceomarginata]